METHAAPRILISRMSAIGDAILTLPVACALREHFPHAHLAWVVEKKSSPMVRDHEDLDEVIILPRGWFTSVSGIRLARRALSEVRPTISIDCQGNTKSALAGWLAGAPRRIGYAGKHGGELSGWLNNQHVRPVFSHLTDRSLELLTPLGIHTPRVTWKLPLTSASRRWATRWRRTIPANRVAVLNPGGTWKSKLWEDDRYASVARYLRDRYRLQSVVIWGTPSERESARRITVLAGGAATLAPRTDLHHLGAMLETADLFISGDTGPLHMAVAVGTPTIGLYGATRPVDCGPYGHTAIQRAYESGSRRHRRSADNRAMRAIGVEHVCEAVDELELRRANRNAA